MSVLRWVTTALDAPWSFGLALWTAGLVFELAAGARDAAPPLTGERRCLSLRRLVEVVADARSRGAQLPDDALRLGGIRFVEGFVVDEERRDVILVGRAGEPSLAFDDLVLALRARDEGEFPYCSLDPAPEGQRRLAQFLAQPHDDRTNLESYLNSVREALGPQTVVVEGVPRASRWAHAMVASDYRMKALHQGLAAVEGVQSGLDRSLERARKLIHWGLEGEQPCSISRLWFHLESGDPRFVRDGNGAFLASCRVAISTEEQVAVGGGELVDVGRRDRDTEAFARDLAAALPQLSESEPDFALLSALYRLLAVTLALRKDGALERVSLDLAALLDAHTAQLERAMGPDLPALSNGRRERIQDGGEVHALRLVVVGGVSMRVDTARRAFRASDWECLQLASARRSILRARPGATALSWSDGGQVA